jgi:hypothetical protein
VKLLVTDLTRMLGGHICVAGIDIDKGKRVRPLAASPLTARLLASRGGIFGIGHVLDIGRTSPRQSKPEVEDVRFELRSARVLSSLPAPEFVEQLRRVSGANLSAIGSDLVTLGKNLVVPEGKGKCSLVTIRTEAAVEIFQNPRGRPRLRWQEDFELPITDIRLYKDDLETPDGGRVAWLRAQLRNPQDVFLCFGLGRPFEGYHWLQLNNVHMSACLEWPVQ